MLIFMQLINLICSYFIYFYSIFYSMMAGVMIVACVLYILRRCYDQSNISLFAIICILSRYEKVDD